MVSCTNEKAAQCAALKVVGPHGLEPWTKDYELPRNAANPVKSGVQRVGTDAGNDRNVPMAAKAKVVSVLSQVAALHCIDPAVVVNRYAV